MWLYWNDDFWYFERNPKKSGRNLDFVLVKKLFVSNITEPLNQKENLAKHFRSFGSIDNIEIFEEVARNSNADTVKSPVSTYSAYVTFKESKSAYLALKDRLQKRKYSSIKVIPADSWRQPTIKLIELDSTLGHIMELNDDCLLEIFKYCDLDTLIRLSNTCTRFRDLIQQNVFPRFKTLVFNFVRNTTFIQDTTLIPYRIPKRDEIKIKYSTFRELHDKMCAVGEYVEEVKLLFSEENYRTYNLPKNLNRMMDIFIKQAGNSLRKLSIIGITLTKEMQAKLHSIFGRLEYFEWHSLNYQHDGCDLVNLCPNLKGMTLSVNMNMSINVNHWQSLECVNFLPLVYMRSDHYEMFFRNNSNINSLGLFTYEPSEVLAAISIHLKKLDKLVIRDSWEEEAAVQVSQISALLQLNHLKTLKLLEIRQEYANDLLMFLTRLPHLHYIKLSVRIDLEDTFPRTPLINYKVLIPLAKSAINLRKLSLRRCKLRYKTVLDFVRYAKVLEVLDLRLCEVAIRRELIEDIVKVKAYAKVRRKETTVLTLVIDQQIEEGVRKLLQRDDVRQVLQVVKKTPNPDNKTIHDLLKLNN